MKIYGSPRFTISGLDWQKIKTGALVGFGGVVTTLIPMFVLGVTYTVQFNGHTVDYSLGVAWLASVAVNFIRKWISDNSQKPA